MPMVSAPAESLMPEMRRFPPRGGSDIPAAARAIRQTTSRSRPRARSIRAATMVRSAALSARRSTGRRAGAAAAPMRWPTGNGSTRIKSRLTSCNSSRGNALHSSPAPRSRRLADDQRPGGQIVEVGSEIELPCVPQYDLRGERKAVGPQSGDRERRVRRARCATRTACRSEAAATRRCRSARRVHGRARAGRRSSAIRNRRR